VDTCSPDDNFIADTGCIQRLHLIQVVSTYIHLYFIPCRCLHVSCIGEKNSRHGYIILVSASRTLLRTCIRRHVDGYKLFVRDTCIRLHVSGVNAALG